MKQLKLDDLQDELIKIQSTSKSILERSNRSIIVCKSVLKSLRKETIRNGFKTVQQEIEFFKHTKQGPLMELIYFCNLRAFEMQFPKGGKESQLKTIKRKINKINRFFLKNIEFGQYLELGYTHFDELYFTRKANEKLLFTFSKFHYQDTEFSTPKELLLAEFKAYSALVPYLEKRLFCIEHSSNPRKLNWPFGNANFIELISAFCAAGLHKHNNISLIELVRRFQEIFDLDTTGDVYNIRNEIYNRKTNQTRLIDLIKTAYMNELNKKDGKSIR